MNTLLSTAHETLEHDIDPDFLASVGKNLAWEYPSLFERINKDPAIPEELKAEIYSKQRAYCAVKSLLFACKIHGVPYEFRTLSCNGQKKLLVKIGRIVVIQEPMLEVLEPPRTSNYKRQLVSATGFVQQIEMDFGDSYRRIIDWSGSLVAVLLHAPAGPKFTLEDRSLGAFMLGVPNESYTGWLMRLDLHRVAVFGFDAMTDGVVEPRATEAPVVQKDNVVVKVRRREIKRNGDVA
ncbi:hypothetical protein [Stappia sp. TSB10GB4]|uniref:hypothetical protein n=1 Tax=Stappia sp. TSB10GB4 TaxID=2003584 RepID=UPI001646652D|nr:hypothetical protein [Stappia sp. TSB10GB4]